MLRRDDIAPADEDRTRDLLVHDLLRGLQHIRVCTFRIGKAAEAFGREALGSVEDGLHDEAGLVNELLELVDVSVEVLDRPGGDAAVHCGLGNGRGDLDDQARIERLRDDVGWPEYETVRPVGLQHAVGHVLARCWRAR
jgi:hypothetical protein